MIVEGMLDRKSSLSRDLAGYDPEHMASSIASVLESLWKARRWMRWQPAEDGNPRAGGEWVPDLGAIVASATEARRAETPKSGSVHDGAVPQGDAHE
jgi:hypothetical protein